MAFPIRTVKIYLGLSINIGNINVVFFDTVSIFRYTDNLLDEFLITAPGVWMCVLSLYEGTHVRPPKEPEGTKKKDARKIKPRKSEKVARWPHLENIVLWCSRYFSRV